MTTPAVLPSPCPATAFETGAAQPGRAADFLYLDQDAVIAAGVFDMRAAMRSVGAALVEWHHGRARQPHKQVLRAADDAACESAWRVNGLCASIGDPLRYLGMKWIASFPANRQHGLPRASALIILNAPATGLPLAVLDGTLINAMRTGAITALGVEALAPFHARRAAVIGAGVQARTQVLGLWTACPRLEDIAIVHPRREAAEACAADCRRRWAAPAHAVYAPADRTAAIRAADIALTITTADQPVLFAADIQPGALTVQLSGHECEFALVAACDKIVCDDWETVKHRGIMTPALMHRQGLLPDSRIDANLGQILAGARPGRESAAERIHFVHMGLGLDDVALAAHLFEQATERGLGQRLRLWREPMWV